MRVPTITVDRNGTAVVINRSDFRPGVDRPWGAPAPPEPIPVPGMDPAAEKDLLLQQLAARGVRKHRNTSLDTLRKLAAEG